MHSHARWLMLFNKVGYHQDNTKSFVCGRRTFTQTLLPSAPLALSPDRSLARAAARASQGRGPSSAGGPPGSGARGSGSRKGAPAAADAVDDMEDGGSSGGEEDLDAGPAPLPPVLTTRRDKVRYCMLAVCCSAAVHLVVASNPFATAHVACGSLACSCPVQHKRPCSNVQDGSDTDVFRQHPACRTWLVAVS